MGLVAIAAFVCNVVSFASALVAAVYWFSASRVRAAPPWDPGQAPVIETLEVSGWIGAAITAIQQNGRLNKIAALWSGTAAFFLGCGIFLGLLTSLVE